MTAQATTVSAQVIKGRVTSILATALTQLHETQDVVAMAMAERRPLSVSTVERLLEQEQVARNLEQVNRAVKAADSSQQVLAALRLWVEDATEQVMSPSCSRSTSLVRTEQMMAEEKALKLVTRSISRIVDHYTD